MDEHIQGSYLPVNRLFPRSNEVNSNDFILFVLFKFKYPVKKLCTNCNPVITDEILLNNSYYIASLLLQHNQFTGRIDDSLLSTRCGNLQALDFSANYFTGKYSLVTIFIYT